MRCKRKRRRKRKCKKKHGLTSTTQTPAQMQARGMENFCCTWLALAFALASRFNTASSNASKRGVTCSPSWKKSSTASAYLSFFAFALHLWTSLQFALAFASHLWTSSKCLFVVQIFNNLLTSLFSLECRQSPRWPSSQPPSYESD